MVEGTLAKEPCTTVSSECIVKQYFRPPSQHSATFVRFWYTKVEEYALVIKDHRTSSTYLPFLCLTSQRQWTKVPRNQLRCVQ